MPYTCFAALWVAGELYFQYVPIFVSRQTPLYLCFYSPFTNRLKNTVFIFYFLLLGTQLPYVELPIRPVTHKQAGNPYGLLGNPTPT